MFGDQSKPAPEFIIFHDESGTYGAKNERWFFHGMLFVPANKVQDTFDLLQRVRTTTGYHTELHFKTIKPDLESSQAQCAKGWLDLFRREILRYAFYTCFAVDTESEAFEASRYPKPYLAYNFFAKQALVGGMCWFFHDRPQIGFRVISDAKTRQSDDNFSTYLHEAVVATMERKRLLHPAKYPLVVASHPRVGLLSSQSQVDCLGLDLIHGIEILQLTDLLTSGLAQAVIAGAERESKVGLALLVADMVHRARLKPWNQNYEFHRKFDLSCFPDKNGNFFNARLKITDKNQLQMPM